MILLEDIKLIEEIVCECNDTFVCGSLNFLIPNNSFTGRVALRA